MRHSLPFIGGEGVGLREEGVGTYIGTEGVRNCRGNMPLKDTTTCTHHSPSPTCMIR